MAMLIQATRRLHKCLYIDLHICMLTRVNPLNSIFNRKLARPAYIKLKSKGNKENTKNTLQLSK